MRKFYDCIPEMWLVNCGNAPIRVREKFGRRTYPLSCTQSFSPINQRLENCVHKPSNVARPGVFEFRSKRYHVRSALTMKFDAFSTSKVYSWEKLKCCQNDKWFFGYVPITVWTGYDLNRWMKYSWVCGNIWLFTYTKSTICITSSIFIVKSPVRRLISQYM